MKKDENSFFSGGTTPKENKIIAFLGGKFVIYILVITILLGLSILIYTNISYIFTPIDAMISSLLTPIILAYILYYILNPLVNRLSVKIPRGLASMIAILVGIVVIFVIIVGMVPIIVEQTQNLVSSLPKHIENVRGYLNTNAENTYVKAINQYISENLNTSKISQQALSIFSSVVTNVGSTVSSTAEVVMTAPFVLFFLLKDASKFKKYLVSNLPQKLKNSIGTTIDEIDDKVGSYIQGQMFVSLCIGIMLFIGYSIIGLNYGFSLATIAMFLSVVPYIGPILAITPAMLVAASTSWIMVLKMLIVWFTVQFIEGNILSPNIMGRSMNMHPLTVIFVLMIGLNLFGVVGAILGIPGYSILKVLFSKFLGWLKNRYYEYFGDDEEKKLEG